MNANTDPRICNYCYAKTRCIGCREGSHAIIVFPPRVMAWWEKYAIYGCVLLLVLMAILTGNPDFRP